MTTHKLSAQAAATLDRPIWSALTSKHRTLALGDGLAFRYPQDIAPFAAVADSSAGALASLRSLATAGPVALASSAPLVELDGLETLSTSILRQMIAMEVASETPGVALVELGANDAPDMLELTGLTKPGPFAARTYELGRYFGVRDGGRLVGMAGERMRLDGFTEVSAVCVHPDHRGKGYAQILMKHVMGMIARDGDIPILHVLAENPGAIALYERLGFVTRRTLHLAVLRPAGVAG